MGGNVTGRRAEMRISVTIEAEYESEEEAEIVMKALEPENRSYVESEIEGSTLRFTMESDSIGTALNTADDLIFSEMIIENMMGFKSENSEN